MASVKKLLFGASYLGIGAFVSKLLGALYRIPLTNLIGANGLGLYQMIFPVYTVILDFAGAGAPNAISRLIASENSLDKSVHAQKILKVSIKLFSILGLIGAIFMLTFSFLIAKLQGNINATLGYVFMSPAVFFVSLIACFRGYFQGQMNMKPTAVSQILEQVIKLVVGLLLVYLFLPNISLAVGGMTIAVTLSEMLSLLYLYILYRKQKGKLNTLFNEKIDYKKEIKKLIKTAIPITLIGVMIPFSHFIESFLIVNIMGKYTNMATSIYGLYSGAAHTVISLPVSILYGLGVSAIPQISNLSSSEKAKQKAFSILSINLILAVPISIITYFSSDLIVGLLFGGLSVQEKIIVSELIKLTSVNIVFLSFVQTSNSILIGKGKLYKPVISLLIGIIIKTLLEITLINNVRINIYGAVIGSIACYFVVSLVNLKLINEVGKERAKLKVKDKRYIA